MLPRTLLIALLGGAVLTAGLLSAPSAPSAERARSPICARGNTSVEVDPRGLLPLTDGNPIGPSAAAALRYVKPSDRAQVRSVVFATADEQRGPQAKYACGTRVWQRTIVVYVLARAYLPAASASQRVFFVGRFRTGYRVWQIVH
jgi:hypothetical protein